MGRLSAAATWTVRVELGQPVHHISMNTKAVEYMAHVEATIYDKRHMSVDRRWAAPALPLEWGGRSP